MNIVDTGNLLLRTLGLSSLGPQGEKLGWSISVVDAVPDEDSDLPGACCYKNSTIYLKREALNGGEFQGKPFSALELITHEISHIVPGNKHDENFDAELLRVRSVLSDHISKLEPEDFKTRGHAAISKMLSGWTADQYRDAIWTPISGLKLSQLVRDAIASGALKESDIPGGRITPNCPKRSE